ncbi:hypothetical protein [Streptomyces sp. NPDC058280]|uniref:hypothetical protein n=1 Tax=Streptomyces sp. NPDC058280 TaxID=3346419 RepID=UPI0036E9B74D
MHEPSDVTVELDGLGRQLSELPAGTRTAQESGPAREAGPEGSDRPVFVDASGRRSKKFRRAGWVVAIACACYAMTLVAALVGGNSSAPWLQIPGLADKKKPDTVEIQPAPTTSVSVSVTPGASAPTPTATDANGAVIPLPSDSATPGASGEPEPGTSVSAKPPKASPGAGGTKPDPGTSVDPGSDPGGDPGTTGGTGGEPQQPDPPVDSGSPTADPSPSAELPSAQQGGRPMAVEGAP